MHREPETNAVVRELCTRQGTPYAYRHRVDDETRHHALLETPLPEDILRCDGGSIVLWVPIHRGGELLLDVTVPQPRCTMDILKAIHSVYTMPITPELLARLQAVPCDQLGYVARAADAIAAGQQLRVADVLRDLKYFEGLCSKQQQGHYDVLSASYDWAFIHSGFDPDGGLTKHDLATAGRPIVSRGTMHVGEDLGAVKGTVDVKCAGACRGGCGKLAKSVCSACKRVAYCSRECQQALWDWHKQDCKAWRTGRD